MSCPFAALRGAESPVFGTMIRSIDDARGLPCSIGLNVPDPLSERPGLPCAKAVAGWPGITCAIWPDLEVRDLDLAPQHVDAGARRRSPRRETAFP